MTTRQLIALPLVLLAAACSTKAPPVAQPEIDLTTPADWMGSDALTDPVDGQWWRTFGDESLNGLVELAVERNWDLAAAAARFEQATAGARIAGADLKPQVGANLDGNRAKQNFVGFPIPGAGDVLTTTATRVSLSVGLSWEIDLWGRLRAAARAGIADAQAAGADLRGAKQSIAAQAALIWFAIEEAREQLAFAEKSAESFHDTAEFIRARYERGVRPAIDLRLALSNLAAAEVQIEVRKRQQDIALRQLEILLGDYPSANLLARFPANPLPESLPPVPVGLPSELVARRPDLIAAERRLAASEQRHLSAKKSLYPRFSLTASGGTVSTQLGDLVDGNFSVWSLFANLTAPLYQGGRLRANVAFRDAEADGALAFYASSVLRAFSEVETALASERFLAEQERYTAESARQLVAAEELALNRYRLGIGDYLTVLDSQTRAFVAQSNLIALRRARLANRVDLHLALGGGFESPTLAAFDRAEEPEEADEEDPS